MSTHLNTIRTMNNLEQRVKQIENSVEDELKAILLTSTFKLLILAAALFIPWDSIRDFWVKMSMGIFIIKSMKKIKKGLKVAKKIVKPKKDKDKDKDKGKDSKKSKESKEGKDKKKDSPKGDKKIEMTNKNEEAEKLKEEKK